jgi:hypothetical protein
MVRITIIITIAALAPVLFSASCAGEAGAGLDYVRFTSGGAWHPGGYGAWTVKVAGSGAMSVRHQVGETVTDKGEFRLTDEEMGRISALVAALDVAHLESSTRPGLPDEVRYDFAVKDDTGVYVRWLWIGDARESEAVMNLVDYLSALIEKYTGERPVMR